MSQQEACRVISYEYGYETTHSWNQWFPQPGLKKWRFLGLVNRHPVMLLLARVRHLPRSRKKEKKTYVSTVQPVRAECARELTAPSARARPKTPHTLGHVKSEASARKSTVQHIQLPAGIRPSAKGIRIHCPDRPCAETLWARVHLGTYSTPLMFAQRNSLWIQVTFHKNDIVRLWLGVCNPRSFGDRATQTGSDQELNNTSNMGQH